MVNQVRLKCYLTRSASVTIILSVRSGMPSDVPLITKPAELAGLTYVEALNQITWTQTLRDQLQTVSQHTDHIASCMSAKDGHVITSNHSSYPKLEFEYVPVSECDLTSSTVGSIDGWIIQWYRSKRLIGVQLLYIVKSILCFIKSQYKTKIVQTMRKPTDSFFSLFSIFNCKVSCIFCISRISQIHLLEALYEQNYARTIRYFETSSWKDLSSTCVSTINYTGIQGHRIPIKTFWLIVIQVWRRLCFTHGKFFREMRLNLKDRSVVHFF